MIVCPKIAIFVLQERANVMTAKELDALARLEYNLNRLTELVARQSVMLKKQQAELLQLRQDKAMLEQHLHDAQERGRMAEIAEGICQAQPEKRAEALAYLSDIIEDVRLSIRQLELE